MAAKLNKMVHQGEAAFASYSPQRSRNAAEQQQPAVQQRPSDILNVKNFTQTLFFSLKFYPRVRNYNQPKCLTKQRK